MKSLISVVVNATELLSIETNKLTSRIHDLVQYYRFFYADDSNVIWSIDSDWDDDVQTES